MDVIKNTGILHVKTHRSNANGWMQWITAYLQITGPCFVSSTLSDYAALVQMTRAAM